MLHVDLFNSSGTVDHGQVDFYGGSKHGLSGSVNLVTCLEEDDVPSVLEIENLDEKFGALPSKSRPAAVCEELGKIAMETLVEFAH